MFKPCLNVLVSIIASAILLPASWSVSAALIGIEDDTTDSSKIIQELFSTGIMQADQVSVVILNPEQAKKSTEVLKRRFRQYGEIAAIKSFAPGIIAHTPSDSTIHYLYAIALAAERNISAANNQLSTVKSSKKNRLLYFLAKASIARATLNYESANKLSRLAISNDKTHPFAYNLLGQIATTQGKYDIAAKNFTTAIKFAPEYSVAYSNLAGVQFLQAKFDNSLQSFSKSLSLTPGYCPALIGRASASLQYGNRASAISDLETCLSNNPKQTLAIKRLATLYLENGELSKAENLVKSSTNVAPVFSRVTLADIYLRRNDADAARKILIGLTSKSAQAHYLLSFCDMLDNNAKNALNQIKQARLIQPDSSTLKLTALIYTFYDQKKINIIELEGLENDPSIGPLAVFVTGSAYASKNDYNKARQYWSDARDLVPGFILNGLSQDQIEKASSRDEQKHLSLGVLFYLKGYYEAAKSQFGKAIAINRDSFLANFFNALALTQSGETDKAVSNLLSSVSRANGFFPSNYMLAEGYLKQGDVDKAINYYQTAANSEPDQGVLVKLGLLYEGKGRTQDAAKTYQAFIDNHPQSFLGYNQLAWLYAKRGIQLDKALELAMKANQIRPDNASINDTIGWVYFHKKNYAKASQYLNKANDISQGNNPDILFHLASVRYEAGDKKTARKILLKALSVSENFESRSSARQLMEKIETSG